MSRLFLRALVATSLLLPRALAQTPQPPPPLIPAPIDKNAPEMTTSESPALFQTRINLVSVPVVVRDSKGHAIGTLTKDNFQVFDKGKAQEILRFSVEKAGDLTARAAKNTDSLSPDAAPADLPERFIAYVFDDLHLPVGDLARARDAVGRQLANIPKTDRAAIYTTSGQNTLDFTDDVDRLQDTLLLLRSRPIQTVGGTCPKISEYVADRIVNLVDKQAIALVAADEQICSGTGPLGAQLSVEAASEEIKGLAQQVAGANDQATRIALTSIKDIVRRMGATPGQRILVLVTNGFLATLNSQEKNDILDRAIKGNVTINALEARGLWTDGEDPDAAKDSGYANMLRQYEHQGSLASEEVLAEFTAGSGGSFFHNNNDLGLGVRQATAAPEFYYVLAFAPQNLKLDGSFHALKVTLKAGVGYGMDIVARKGYYAPRKLADAEENAKEEMREALFSRDEISELPAELRVKFFKSSEKDATVTVVCRVDPKHIRYRKSDGRNVNTIRVLTGLFDRNGTLVSAILKKLDIQMTDATMAKLLASGSMSLSTNFSVPAGNYMIRMVVMDAEGQETAALNGAVAIQ